MNNCLTPAQLIIALEKAGIEIGGSETLTTLSFNDVNSQLSYTDENGTVNTLDLSPLLDDTNLARITSGSFDDITKLITLTRNDLTSFTIDLNTLTITETLTSLSFNDTTKILTYTDEDGTTNNIDLNSLLDDTNLARIVSGTYNDTTKLITLTRDDASTFDIDINTLTVTETLTSISFNDTTKVISYVDENGTNTDLDLNTLLDDTNLARIESGTYDDVTKLITLTRDDLTTINIDTSTLTVTETLTSLSLNTNILTYSDENGNNTDLDLSLYLDDTNLARITSGVYDAPTQTLIFTRDDSSTFSIDASMFFDDTNLVTSVNGQVGIVIIENATQTEDGLMSSEDKTKLDNLDPTLLASNISLYSTTAIGDFGYNKLVTETTDIDYDTVAVDVNTSAISGSNQLLASLISEEGIIVGNPGIINITTVGNIRRVSGGGDTNATFYFELYRRDDIGTETLLATSSITQEVATATYEQFYTTALLNNGDWLPTDRIVLKFYGNKTGASTDPVYDFQFGGSNPVRTQLPVSSDVVPGKVTVQEEDGTPSVQAKTIKFPNDSLVDNGDESVSVTFIADIGSY